MADKAAKKAIGRRKIKKKNGKSVEINTNHTSPFPNLSFLKTAVKTTFAENLYAEQEDDWRKETKDCTFYKIAPTSSKKVLYLHDKLSKQVSSLMIQIKTGKIGLKKFLYERNVFSIEDTECACREGKELVRQILTECSQFGEMKRTL